MAQLRSISQSEVAEALSCQARWDFSYGGHLAGSALRAKRIAPILSAGRAWGAAMAAWHSSLDGALAIDAMDIALESDADAQREHGLHDQAEHDALRERLLRMLSHYIDTADRFRVEPDVEHEFRVPIPSRSGARPSSRYRFHGYADAWRVDEAGRVWLIEFKLRNALVPVEQLQLSRQVRWYAWGWWQQTGERVAGVEVIERWNEPPKPPRVLKSGELSHARDQLCTAEAYLAACGEHDVEPTATTLEALRSRRWQQRVPILFRDGELEEIGREMVSAAHLIGQLDSAKLMPLRNPGRQCGWCQFRDICPAPDSDLVDHLYDRKPPKRDRDREKVTA